MPKPRFFLVLTMTKRLIWLREHVIRTRIYTVSRRRCASYPSTSNIAHFLGHLAVSCPHFLLGGFIPRPPHTTTSQMPFPSKMYFAMLAFLMLAVVHAAPLDPALPNNIPAKNLPSNTRRSPASKRDTIPPFVVPTLSGTKTTRSIPMVMQARAPEIVSHSRTEETRRSMIERNEDIGEQTTSSQSPRAYKRSESEQGLINVEEVKRLESEEKSKTSCGVLCPRTHDHSSDKSMYQPISSISSRQLRAPDYDSAGNQSNSTTEENGSHPTTDEEQKQSTKGEQQNGSSSTKDQEKRAVPVEWSKTWSENRKVNEYRRSSSDDRIARRDEGSLLVTRPGDHDTSA
ncbi:hypothetical protein IW261DRAFT_329744 [Armillaria novae-zelandiae]|uniref:Uncharacterized protein n=1 Tax=Armillaria novae-zelandiae TaxID=153914 RepID=A0AA39P4G5_9AGAR|nr:hypothetical protein IW261DRAFT_329744 [Armillaria novae-zelandiae]